MNAPLTSASFPHGLPAMRSEAEAREDRKLSMMDVIARGARPRGMSDGQRDEEFAAQKRLYAAVDELRRAITDVNDGSVIAHVSMAAFEAFIHDEIPDEKTWDERISEARAV